MCRINLFLLQYNPRSDYPYNFMEECLFLYKFGTLVSKYIITVEKKTEGKITYSLFLYEPYFIKGGRELKHEPIETMEGTTYEKDALKKVKEVIKFIKDKEEEKKSKVEV